MGTVITSEMMRLDLTVGDTDPEAGDDEGLKVMIPDASSVVRFADNVL